MSRNSVDGRLNRNTLCSGAEVAPVQCARDLSVCKLLNVISYKLRALFTR